MDAASHEFIITITKIDTLGGAITDGICSLAYSGDTLYIAYIDSAVGGLKLVRSSDLGLSW